MMRHQTHRIYVSVMIIEFICLCYWGGNLQFLLEMLDSNNVEVRMTAAQVLYVLNYASNIIRTCVYRHLEN